MIIFQGMYRRVEIFQLLVRRKLLWLKCPCGVSVIVNVAFGTLKSCITSNNLPGWPTIYQRFYCLPVVNRMESFRGDRANPKIKRNSLNPLRLGLVLRHDSFSFSFLKYSLMWSWVSHANLVSGKLKVIFISELQCITVNLLILHTCSKSSKSCSFARVFLYIWGLPFSYSY